MSPIERSLSPSADDDSEFSFGNDVDTTPPKSHANFSQYDMLMPLIKEALKDMDPFTPQTKALHCQQWRNLVNEQRRLQAKSRLDFAQQRPNGSVVSAKVPAKNAGHKHKKQRRF
jgi:hypothetical protein